MPGEHEHRERLARIEGDGRAVNVEIVRQRGQLVDGEKALLFRCECGHEECREGVWLPLGVYECVRDDTMQFVVLAGHELPEFEEILERGEDYAVVRKGDEVRHILEAGAR